MYEIISRDRRVTEYVKIQAYKWLYSKLLSDDYTPHGAESNTIILTIKNNAGFDDKTYQEFVGYFINNPYNYILNQKNPKKIKGITADKLSNYFVKFNEVVLPVGFIKDFFEDDYETQRDIEEYYNLYTEATLNDFILGCQTTANRKELDIKKTENANPFIFNTRIGFHVLNIVKAILTIISVILITTCIVSEQLVERMILAIKGTPPVGFNYHLIVIIANIIFIIFMIPKIIQLIKLIIFYVNYFRIRLYAKSLRSALDDFNSNVVKEFEEFFKVINGNFPVNNYVIDESMYSTLPAGTKKYINVLNFSSKNLEDKIRKITTAKLFSFLGFVYKNDAELAAQRPLWRRGIVFSVFLIIVILCFNIPSLRALIGNWLVGIF